MLNYINTIDEAAWEQFQIQVYRKLILLELAKIDKKLLIFTNRT